MNQRRIIFTGFIFVLFSSMATIAMDHYEAHAPLFAAVRNGNFDEVACYAREGGSVNIKDFRGLTPLHIAAEKGHGDLVVLLAYVGAELNACGARGLRPIHRAAMSGSPEIIEFLVDAGAMVDYFDNMGKTALHYAIERTDGQKVALELVRKGADIFKASRWGITPLSLVTDFEFQSELCDAWKVAQGYGKKGDFDALSQQKVCAVAPALSGGLRRKTLKGGAL